MVIDFKINNAHNNTDQLLIFIYLFITSYPSLFAHVSLSHQTDCQLGFSLQIFCFFLCYRTQLTPHLHNNSLSFLLISLAYQQDRPAMKKICPRALRPHVCCGRCSCVLAHAAGCSLSAPSGLSDSEAGETVG